MDNIEQLIVKLKSINLLYVEDDVETRESTLTLFEDIFDNITVAVDGKDGLDKFNNGNFNLIITDISMPNLDGLEMSKIIREKDKDISIIVLTALKDINTVVEAIDVSVDSFVNKPLNDLDLLLNKLNNVLKKIEYVEILKQKEQIKKDQEKIKLILKILRLVGHHWRQPLSVIMSIASGNALLKNIDDKFTAKDLEDSKTITKNVAKLSSILKEIEHLDFENSSVEDIENMISISNKLYGRDLNDK